MKIKIKGPNPFQIQIFDNLLPKLSRIFKIEGQDAESKRGRPDGRTRGGHAVKRIAIGLRKAAKMRRKSRFPRFGGLLIEIEGA